MSIIDISRDKKLNSFVVAEDNKTTGVAGEESNYLPTDDERDARQMIVTDFTKGNITLNKPRREFNDLSLLSRLVVDQMAFNTYQPNDGDALEADETNGWKSRAMRPVVRNKCISIAAHATANIIFPKIYAENEQSDADEDAATVMSDLMESAAEQSGYEFANLESILTALWSPASIVYTGYNEVYRKVKREKGEDGKWIINTVIDEEESGFNQCVIPVDQLYIENFYEHDIQKQGWLILRRVQSYSQMQSKYANYDNFKFVRPGVQLVYNDANQKFYEVYDANMRQDFCEEIIYWNRSRDLMLIMVNGVLLTDADNPNPRIDKLYPFIKFGYEFMDEGKCFYYKSLAFKMKQDANIINSLYPMIIDGTFLNIMPPMFSTGGDMISSDVIIPGAVTTLNDPNSKLSPISINNQGTIQSSLSVLQTVEGSLNESSEKEMFAQGGKSQTAYEISKREQERNMELGLFIQMIASYVRQFGRLRIGDIIQYLTVPDADEIAGTGELVYKTFLMHDKHSDGKNIKRKIVFDPTLPSKKMKHDEYLKYSYDILEEQGDDMELYKVNPELFRKLKFSLTITPDVMQPKSDNFERALKLEEYDRAIANPIIDLEAATKDFLLSAYPKSKKDVMKYIKKQESMPQMPQIPQQQPASAQQMSGAPQAPKTPASAQMMPR